MRALHIITGLGVGGAELQLRLLLRWLPGRPLLFVGDQNYGTHALAHFAQGQGGRLTLVSRFYADANLYEPPPPYAGKGRPRKKGAKLAAPGQVVVATATPSPLPLTVTVPRSARSA